MAMIALLNYGGYFIGSYENINEFLIAYAKHIGNIDTKVFEILANSNEMPTEELIKYINDNCYSIEEEITDIYEIGKKIY